MLNFYVLLAIWVILANAALYNLYRWSKRRRIRELYRRRLNEAYALPEIRDLLLTPKGALELRKVLDAFPVSR